MAVMSLCTRERGGPPRSRAGDNARMPALGPPGPRPFSTHGITVEEGIAVKRFPAMSQVPGEPLGTRPVTRAQEDAVAAALGRLHHAIPPSVLGTVEPAPGRPQLLPGRIRDMAHACDAAFLDSLPRRAYRAALAWLDNRWAERPGSVTGQPVFAQGDPNPRHL